MKQQPDDSTGGERVSRRTALERGALVAVGVGAGSVSAVVAADRGSERRRLSGTQKRKYRALVEAVGSLPGTLVVGARAGSATSRLASLYAKADRGSQTLVDQALDSIDASFAEMGSDQRLAYLGKRLHARKAGSLGLSRGSRVASAVALAAAPFDDRGFNWSTEAVQLWIATLRAYSGS